MHLEEKLDGMSYRTDLSRPPRPDLPRWWDLVGMDNVENAHSLLAFLCHNNPTQSCIC